MHEQNRSSIHRFLGAVNPSQIFLSEISDVHKTI